MRSGAAPAMSWPAKRILPAVGANSPDSRLISVVLPAPLGPMTAWISPATRSSDMPSTAFRPPNCRTTARAVSTGSAMRFLRPVHEAADAPRQQQHRQDDEQTERQQPMARDVGQSILQQNEGESPEDGAIQRAHAAEDHHHQHCPRKPPTEEVGANEAELRSVEIASKAGDRAGNDEGGELVAVGSEAERAHAAFVAADAEQRVAEERPRDEPQHEITRGQHG